MRAIEISSPGGPEVLRQAEVPIPVIRPEEVLIRVAFAGVNRADTGQRAGRYPPAPDVSPFPGLECSGWIVEIGNAVEALTIGSAVCALLAGGGYAEYVAVSAAQVMRIPEGTSMAEAASLPEVACTVYSNLDGVVRGGARSILIHGGASGIGTFAIQWLAACGVDVYCTAGSQEKLSRCIELGVKRAYDHRENAFAKELLAHTDGRGVDAVLDIIGAPYLSDNLDVLAADGTLVVIGTQGGTIAPIDLKTVIRRRLTLQGSGLRGRDVADKARIVAGVERDVWPYVTAGRIRPIIHEVIPLADAARAHRSLEASEHIGKLVLAVSAG